MSEVESVELVPSGVTVSQGFGARVISLPPPADDALSQLLLGLNYLLTLPCVTAGVFLGVWLIIPWIKGTLSAILVSLVLAPLGVFLGGLLGLLVALLPVKLLTLVQNRYRKEHITLNTQTITIQRGNNPPHRIPLADALFVRSGEPPALVLRGGATIPLGAGRPLRLQRWLQTQVEDTLKRAPDTGKPQEIPPALAQLTKAQKVR